MREWDVAKHQESFRLQTSQGRSCIAYSLKQGSQTQLALWATWGLIW